MFKCKSFLAVFSYCELLCLLVPFQTYTWQKKNWALLIELLKEKETISYIIVFIVKRRFSLDVKRREETRRDLVREETFLVVRFPW